MDRKVTEARWEGLASRETWERRENMEPRDRPDHLVRREKLDLLDLLV